MYAPLYGRTSEAINIKFISFNFKWVNFSGRVVYEEKENETLFSRIRKRFGAGGIGE